MSLFNWKRFPMTRDSPCSWQQSMWWKILLISWCLGSFLLFICFYLFLSLKALTHCNGGERISLSIYVYIHTYIYIYINIYIHIYRKRECMVNVWGVNGESGLWVDVGCAGARCCKLFIVNMFHCLTFATYISVTWMLADICNFCCLLIYNITNIFIIRIYTN